MKFVNGITREEISTKEALGKLHKNSIEELTVEDLQTLIDLDILPRMVRSEKVIYMRDKMSFWIDDCFTEGLLVGWIENKDAGKDEARAHMKNISNKYGKLCLQGW